MTEVIHNFDIYRIYGTSIVIEFTKIKKNAFGNKIQFIRSEIKYAVKYSSEMFWIKYLLHIL